mmetsp:Transcript_17596/g.31785  ORF Transcript_17596/g.31785 Transcript_17596/m.31785 type:complete len:316 (+) Transcript_17596:190-1137(+)
MQGTTYSGSSGQGYVPNSGQSFSEADGLMSDPSGRPGMFHTKSIGLLALVPWSIFTLIMMLWTFFIHQAPWVVYIAIAVCLALCFLFAALRSRKPQTSPLHFWLVLGVLGFVAVGAACAVGDLNDEENMSKYWNYQGEREYTNVDPSEPALTHLDAGSIHFTNGTRLDTSQAVGYHSGNFYCVAPVLSPSGTSHTIEYMAAGMDCCEQRGTFTCDDAAESSVRSGLVYLDSDPSVSEFRRAAEQAAAVWNLQISSDSLFLKWVEDPEREQRRYWYSALWFALIAAVVALGAFTVVAFGLHFSTGQTRRGKPVPRY